MRGEKCGDGVRQTQCAKDKSNQTNKMRKMMIMMMAGKDLRAMPGGREESLAASMDQE